MRRAVKFSFLAICAIFIIACSEKNEEAKMYLQNIQSLYEKGDYETATLKIDSIQILFPKAFDEIKGGIALLQDVRKAQNIKMIADCDSAINFLQPKVDSIKNLFKYDIDKKYQEKGRYLPKSTLNAVLTSTTLRSGVNENGQLFIESVFVGGNQYHDAVKVSLKDGSFAQTLSVNEDGLNFRFTDGGRHYETITFSGKDQNNVGRFIYAFADKPLTVTLTGKNTTSFGLSNVSKKAISDSYLLSTWILDIDSLNIRKEKAALLIEYIDKKKAGTAPTENAE